MLHELLSALLGKAGDIIAEGKEAFFLTEKVEFVSAQERKVINSVCMLGFYYSKLEHFKQSQLRFFARRHLSRAEDSYATEDSTADSSAYLKVFPRS